MSYPYSLTEALGSRARLGLIVLQSDETIEQDFRRAFPGGDVAVYTTRVPSGAAVTPQTLNAMADTLTQSAALLPPSVQFDAIGYGCTSGATIIGAQRVADLVGQGAHTGGVTNPLSATLAGLHALKVTKIAIVSPYIETVCLPMQQAFEAGGVKVSQTLSFGEEQEARVARIDPSSIYQAACAAGADPEVEAVFLSCTNLRTFDILADLEAKLGKPVLSSNQALAWHMAQMAGAGPLHPSLGRLGQITDA